MGLLDVFKKNKKNPITDANPADLRKEQIKLEREEKIKSAEVDKLAQQKKSVFEKGFNASKPEQRTLARKMKEIDRSIKLTDKHLRTISNQILVVNNIMFVIEQKNILEASGVLGDILNMPMGQLNTFLSEVNIEQSMQDETLTGIIGTFDTEHGLMGEMEEDSETQGLIDVWNSGTEEEADEILVQWENKSKDSDEGLEFN